MISAVASTAKLSCRQGSAKTDPSGAMKPRSSNIDGSSTKAWLSAGGTGRGCGSAAVGQWGSRAVGNVPEQIPHVDYSKSISRSTTFETPTTPREPSYEDTSIFRQYGPPEKLNPRLHAHGSTYVVSTPTEDKMLASRQPRRILTCRGERKEVQNLHLRVLQGQLASSKICCHSERVEKRCIFSEYALQEHDRSSYARRKGRRSSSQGIKTTTLYPRKDSTQYIRTCLQQTKKGKRAIRSINAFERFCWMTNAPQSH